MHCIKYIQHILVCKNILIVYGLCDQYVTWTFFTDTYHSSSIERHLWRNQKMRMLCTNKSKLIAIILVDERRDRYLRPRSSKRIAMTSPAGAATSTLRLMNSWRRTSLAASEKKKNHPISIQIITSTSRIHTKLWVTYIYRFLMRISPDLSRTHCKSIDTCSCELSSCKSYV